MNDDIQIFTETVRYDDGEQHVFIKPLCDMFDLDYDNQYQNIQRDIVMKNLYTSKADFHVFGDNRPRAALTKVGFVRWVQMLNAEIVRPELKDKLIQYQINIMEWIMGKIDVDIAVRKAYKRKDELKRTIKENTDELKACEKFIKSYLESKTYQVSLSFDQKFLN